MFLSIHVANPGGKDPVGARRKLCTTSISVLKVVSHVLSPQSISVLQSSTDSLQGPAIRERLHRSACIGVIPFMTGCTWRKNMPPAIGRTLLEQGSFETLASILQGASFLCF